jgi:NADH dehydrogenase FAD-containing subunit
MYVFMGHMKFEHTQSYENNFGKKTINLVQGLVTTVVPESKEILLDNNAKIAYDKLVLATGSKPINTDGDKIYRA